MTNMLRPAHLLSAVALVGVTLGGAVATSALGNVSAPANVKITAQRVDAGALVAAAPNNDMLVVVDLVNAQRKANGLGPFAWHDKVAAAAGTHSTDMAEHRQMQHPGTDGSNAGVRLERAGFTWTSWGETIGAGYQDPAQLVQAWMNSPGHKAILLGSYQLVGIARVESSDGTPYWTLVAATGS